MVADFPVPVAPSSTTSGSAAVILRSSSSIACGWSPAGRCSLTTWNRLSASWCDTIGRKSDWVTSQG